MPTSLFTVVPSRVIRDRVTTAVALVVFGVGGPWHSIGAQTRVVTARSQAPSGAWSLPDPESLISRAIIRIITQDRPAGIPIAEYSAKRFGRTATTDAVRHYNGQSLAPIAFGPITDWSDTGALDIEPCPAVGGVGCANPTGVWVAITRLERGELSHEINLSYTTQFTAAPALEGQVPQTHRYTFCERWLRVGGAWKYDGFVKMVPP
ncbi:hypothetical protein [Gemmatimonas sp.]|uniref:hypothetical protein n=1 Tax=Gemmatimonas sp. TaxID=1962908 RepID=UPI0039834C4E